MPLALGVMRLDKKTAAFGGVAVEGNLTEYAARPPQWAMRRSASIGGCATRGNSPIRQWRLCGIAKQTARRGWLELRIRAGLRATEPTIAGLSPIASLDRHPSGGTMIDGQRILVTGGAGFIGSHLCDRLIENGHEVLCVDNLSTGRKRNVAHLIGHPRFELMRHNVTIPLYVEVDQIYNLACPASPVHYQHDPIQTTKTSVLGALNMLGLAKRRQCRILQASTSEVYGDPSVHPQPEGYWGNVNPIGPRACYDEGKRCAETLFFDYHRRHHVEIKVARVFNTYGPRMDPHDGRVVSNFIVHALKGLPITVYGDGTQTRSFCYVDDMIEGFVRLMQSPADVIGPMNLGNPGEFTIKELAELVLELTGSKSELAFLPLPQDDPRQRKPAIAVAQERLKWQPTVALREGLLHTIAYFERLLSSGAEAAVNGARASVKPPRMPATANASSLRVAGE
jgi:UDP-glucuronate decarboxylase